jgi:hypothetical protein
MNTDNRAGRFVDPSLPNTPPWCGAHAEVDGLLVGQRLTTTCLRDAGHVGEHSDGGWTWTDGGVPVRKLSRTAFRQERLAFVLWPAGSTYEMGRAVVCRDGSVQLVPCPAIVTIGPDGAIHVEANLIRETP